ncbi:MAG TPA: TadE/TadG family type IV pilus assembly protein [Streptosporangiaceae bacterium]|nr:TadE/TadG family type IV pilus assembly protein [Streptosporangiaceae bacterium]
MTGRDRGNAPLELLLLAPIILFLIGFVIAAGRTSIAQEAVNAAARDAARQASIAPNQAVAEQNAMSSASAALRSDGLDCTPVVSLPGLGAAFGSPIGTSALVRAQVTCVVQLSDLSVPGVPGHLSLRASFTSPIDPYRSRDLALGDFSGHCHSAVTPWSAGLAARQASRRGTGCAAF